MPGKALNQIKFTFSNGSLKSDRVAIPEADEFENGALAVCEVDLHANFPTASAVEIRFGNENTDAAHASRYDESGTLISFAGAAGRHVQLSPARYCTVKKYAQMVSNTTIVTGGLCIAYTREV